MSQWFYAIGGQRYGPVTSGQLKRLAAEGTVRPTDLVLKEGSTTWAAAARVKGLFPVKSEPVLDAESVVPQPSGPEASDPEPTREEQLARLQEALIDGRIDKTMYEKLKADLIPAQSAQPVPRAEPAGADRFLVTGGQVVDC